MFQLLKNNMKATWKTINKLIGKIKAPHCSSQVIDNNQLISDQLAIANHFNNLFANIANKLVEKLSNSSTYYRDFSNPSIFPPIYLNPTTPTEIGKIIRELKSKYSCEIDRMPTLVTGTKNSSDIISTARI